MSHFFLVSRRVALLGSAAVEHEGHAGEYDVWNPHGQHGRPAGVGGEGGRYGLEENVGKAQGQAYAEREAHAALSLFARHGDADECEDEGSEGGGDALVVFHFEEAHVGRAAVFLLVNVVGKLRHGHGLLLVAGVKQVAGLHADDGVHLAA